MLDFRGIPSFHFLFRVIFHKDPYNPNILYVLPAGKVDLLL